MIKEGKFTSEEDNIIRKYANKLPPIEIAELLSRKRAAIHDRAKKLGIKFKRMNSKKNYDKFFSKEEDRILKQWYGKISANEIRSKFLPNRTKSSILLRSKRLGLQLYGKEQWAYHAKARRQYKVNDNFFSDYTLENCYWAGFFAADGHIACRSGNEIVFALSKKDIETVNAFKKALKGTFKIRCRIIKQKYQEARINFTSQQIKEDLINKFNVTPQKTYTLLPPPLENIEHKLAFIIGLTDGDGCISSKDTNCALQIMCTYEVAEWIKDTFDTLIPPKKQYKNISKHKQTKSQYCYSLVGKRWLEIAKKLLQLKIPYKMNRKWNKVIQVLNMRNS